MYSKDVLLLRGAVFYTSMSLWGVKKIDTLTLPFNSVLSAIHQVMNLIFISPHTHTLSLSLSLYMQASLCGQTLVIYEVALSVLRLVRHYCSTLDHREWESIHHILHSTQRHLISHHQVSLSLSLSLMCSYLSLHE